MLACKHVSLLQNISIHGGASYDFIFNGGWIIKVTSGVTLIGDKIIYLLFHTFISSARHRAKTGPLRVAEHAAPQYFLRLTMGVGRNLLQDDFLGLPEHT